MNRKPREFWIAQTQDENLISYSDEMLWNYMDDWDQENTERIHVIEYSEYERVKAQLELAVERLKNIPCCRICANVSCDCIESYEDFVTKTLAEIKKLEEGE